MLGAEYLLVQLLYLLFPLSALVVVYISAEARQYKNFVLYFGMVLLVFCSTYFKPISYSGDEITYLEFYDFTALNGYLPEYLERTEFGFSSLLEFSANILGLEGRLFYSLLSTFGFILVLSSINYNNINVTSFFVFFVTCTSIVFWGLQSPRQYIAICIFFFSLKYIGTKSEYRHYIFIFVAALFHKSVLMVCLVSFLYKIKLSKFSILTICLLTISLSVYGFSGILEDFVSSISFLHGGRYDESDFSLGSGSAGAGYIISISLFLLSLHVYNIIENKSKHTMFLFNMYLFSSLIKFLFVGVDYVNRFYMYFIFSNSLFLAIICWELVKARRPMLFWALIALNFVFYMAASIQKVDTFF